MNKKWTALGIIALLVAMMIPAAFADSNPDSPQLRCEGNNNRIDNTGVSEYRMAWVAKIVGKTIDPRYETVLRAAKNVASFARTPKWQACE